MRSAGRFLTILFSEGSEILTRRHYDLFNVFNGVVLILLSFCILYPFYYAVLNSFNAELSSGPAFLWIKSWTATSYQALFRNRTLLKAFGNTVLRSLAGSVVSLVVCSLAAYALSKPYLCFRKIFMTFLIIPTFFSGGQIPYYINLSNLHLINTFFVYIFPKAFSFFWMIILLSGFRNTPKELEEAAYIDGASTWHVFSRVVLPLNLPVVATIVLYAAVSQWNAWYDTAYYTTGKDLMTLSWLLLRMTKEQSLSGSLGSSGIVRSTSYNPEGLKMAAMVVTSLPIILVYPFLQKFFVKGIMIGSLKG